MYAGSDWMAVLIVLFSVMLLLYGAVYLAQLFLALLQRSGLPLPHGMLSVGVYGFLYLFLSPLLPGVLSYCYDLYRAAQGELSGRVPTTEIFHCYASPLTLVRAWIHVAIQLVLMLLPAAAIYMSCRLFWQYRITAGLSFLPFHAVFFLLGALLLVMSVMYISGCLSPAFFLSVARPELPPHRCLYYSFLSMRARGGTAVAAILKFCAATFLSLFLAGIPFFLYLLPYSIFLYISFSQELSNTI